MDVVTTADVEQLDAVRLQTMVVGLVTGVLLHLGQLEVEMLHDGSRFCNAVQVRNPRTATTLVVSVDIAP